MKYSEDHVWAKLKGSKVELGITKYICDELGEALIVDLPEEGEFMDKGDNLFTVEFSDKEVEFPCPLSGKIVKINEDLEEDASILNEDSDNTFIVKLELEDVDELDELLSLKQYKSICD